MLNDNIKKLLKAKKMSSKELALECDVSPTHISYILNNKRAPSMDLIKKIAKALGVTENELFDSQTSHLSTEIHETDMLKKHQINTVAAHLDEKNLTAEKLKLLNDYIDILFKD